MSSIGKKNVAISGLLLILLTAVTVCVGYGLRDKYFHFYVHKRLIFFLDKEFKDLFNRYAIDKNFASIMGRNDLGIIITYKVSKHDRSSIQFKLVKNLNDGRFSFSAEIAAQESNSHYNFGNPHIFMNIPMEHFESVVQNGLSQTQIDRLFDAAEKSKWAPFEGKESVEINPKPQVIVNF